LEERLTALAQADDALMANNWKGKLEEKLTRLSNTPSTLPPIRARRRLNCAPDETLLAELR
jgi:hypothetical protein